MVNDCDLGLQAEQVAAVAVVFQKRLDAQLAQLVTREFRAFPAWAAAVACPAANSFPPLERERVTT